MCCVVELTLKSSFLFFYLCTFASPGRIGFIKKNRNDWDYNCVWSLPRMNKTVVIFFLKSVYVLIYFQSHAKSFLRYIKKKRGSTPECKSDFGWYIITINIALFFFCCCYYTRQWSWWSSTFACDQTIKLAHLSCYMFPPSCCLFPPLPSNVFLR